MVYVDPDGGKTYFDIASYDSWQFPNYIWTFTVYPSSGTGGEAMSGVHVSAPENNYINGGSQTGALYLFSEHVTTNFIQRNAYHVNFTNAGGTKAFRVHESTPSWQITNIPSWLTVSPTNGTSTSNHNVTITAKQNSTESARYCTLSFNGHDFYVYQGSDKIDIIESSTGNSFCFLFQNGKKGQSKELTITSSADWTIDSYYSGSDSWLSLSTMSGKAGKTKLTLSLLEDTYSNSDAQCAFIYFKIGGAAMKKIVIIAE